MNEPQSNQPFFGVIVILAVFALFNDFLSGLTPAQIIFVGFKFLLVVGMGIFIYVQFFSQRAKEKREIKSKILDIPENLRVKSENSVFMGVDTGLDIPVYLPDSIRKRHIHILGATGSGKTESVILNFLGQDVKRGLGAIILDAKGDQSFVDFLKNQVPQDRLAIFDLSDENSLSYNPLLSGSALESAQRLFSSMTWSEEYYKSKALSALQTIYQYHYSIYQKNPTLLELKNYLDEPISFSNALTVNKKSKEFENAFSELSGLRDQLKSLSVGHLEKLLSLPKENGYIDLNEVYGGKVIYFRLQSLLSPQAVNTLGKLIIQNLNYMAGSTHRAASNHNAKLIPVYLDEFASFACPEFADLISKARSAGFALHFSHQSIGDLEEVSKGFLNRITDNSATKIVLRINDPDSAEFFARSFGTKLYKKFTQKITQNSEDSTAELVGEGTQREAHQFRSSPDNFKTLPTGNGSVLVAHGFKTNEGASHVFNIQFPKLT